MPSPSIGDYFDRVNIRDFKVDPTGKRSSTAGFRDAMNELSRLTYTPILDLGSGTYLLDQPGASDTELMLTTRAIQIVGSGMNSCTLNVPAGVGSSCDVIRYAPAAGGAESQGFKLANLKIAAASTGTARHAINIDIDAASRFVRQLTIEDCWIGGSTGQTFGGRAVEATNTIPNTTSIFTVRFVHNIVFGGFRLLNVGDSILFLDNAITGANAGIEVQQVSGAALLTLLYNNITSTGGGVWIKAGTAPRILYNWVETQAAFAGGSGNNALIDIDGGASSRIASPVIVGNMLGLLTGYTGDAIRLNYCDDAKVEDNDFNLVEAASNGCKTTANARRTRFGESNRRIGGSGTLKVATTSMQVEYDDPIVATLSNSTAVANTASETNFDKSVTIPANSLKVGDVIRMRGGGPISTDAAGTIVTTLRPKLNTQAGGLVAITAPAGASNTSWHLDAQFIVRSIGASGSIMPLGGYAGIQAAGTGVITSIGASALTVDTTANITAQISAQFASARAGDSITLAGLTVEVLSGGTVA